MATQKWSCMACNTQGGIDYNEMASNIFSAIDQAYNDHLKSSPECPGGRENFILELDQEPIPDIKEE